MDFLTQHWIEISGGILTAIGIVILLRKGAKSGVSEILFYLVTRAEQEFKSKTGELKYASVVTWLYERMPVFCRFMLSQKEIDTLIESAVVRMKEYLKQNSAAEKIVSQQ